MNTSTRHPDMVCTCCGQWRITVVSKIVGRTSRMYLRVTSHGYHQLDAIDIKPVEDLLARHGIALADMTTAEPD